MKPRLNKKLFASVACLAVGLCLAAQAQASAGQWQRMGPEGGQVLSLAVAKDGTVYLGTPDGHVFASRDHGGHWELRGRAGERLDGVVQALITDVLIPSRLYAGIWYLDPAAGGGVFQSDNGGKTWRSAGLAGEAVRALEQSSLRSEVLVAGTRSGVFQTFDGGRQWRRISAVSDAELHNVDSIAIDPRGPDVVYAGTYHLPWKTTNGGKTWLPIHSGMIDDSDVMSLQIDRQDPARLFASACSGIYRSGDAGASWTKLQGIPYSSRRTQQILLDPGDPRVLYAATTEGLWISRDEGENWARVTSRDWVVNAVAALPSSLGTRILIGTEAYGVLASDDAGKSFLSANAGFSHRVISSMAGEPNGAGHLLIQLADSSHPLLETRDGGKNWAPLPGVFSAGAEKLFGTAMAWWAALRSGGGLRYDSRLHEWRALRFAAYLPLAKNRSSATAKRRERIEVERAPRILRVAERGDRTYLATTDGVWVADSQGTLFRRFEVKRLMGPVLDLSVGPQVCALAEKLVACSQDSFDSWAKMPQPPGIRAVSWIRSLADGAHDSLFVGTDKGVFQSDGMTTESWHLVQSGLPGLSSEAMVVSGRLLGVAMSNGGFYVSEDSGKTWARADTASQTGAISDVVADGHGGFEIASRAEGVLHWIP